MCLYFELIYSVPACRFNEFGVDGGLAAKSLSPKFNTFAKHVSVQTGLQVPEVEVRNLVIFLDCNYLSHVLAIAEIT